MTLTLTDLFFFFATEVDDDYDEDDDEDDEDDDVGDDFLESYFHF